MLRQLSGQNESDRRLDLPARDRRLLVVARKLGRLACDPLKDIVDERVEDGHGLVGDPRVGVDLLEDLVDVGRVGLGSLLVALLLVALGLGSLGGGRLLGGGLGSGGLWRREGAGGWKGGKGGRSARGEGGTTREGGGRREDVLEAGALAAGALEAVVEAGLGAMLKDRVRE